MTRVVSYIDELGFTQYVVQVRRGWWIFSFWQNYYNPQYNNQDWRQWASRDISYANQLASNIDRKKPKKMKFNGVVK